MKLPFDLTEDDYVIVCGDFGLLWAKDAQLEYDLDWMSRLPFNILWIQGNHENYNLIKEYPVEMWHGGKVRHIIRDKIILLERGQVFSIEGKTFFTMGGASSHDIQGGILDKNSPTYSDDCKKALRTGLPFRILNESWWRQELPSPDELQEGLINLEKCDYKVDYVISHCASNSLQEKYEHYHLGLGYNIGWYTQDKLTNYFEDLESKLQYKHWYCGHYHEDFAIDNKHTIMYYKVLPLE